jgi:carboxylesterase type B
MTGEVVVVSANDRLNVFGYTYLGPTAGERFAGSGNVGQLDLIAVLEWMRDNISHVGGDPGNVTLFGESGDVGKVCITIDIPAARGLFQKAIVQSGSFLRTAEAAEALEHTERPLRLPVTRLKAPFADDAALIDAIDECAILSDVPKQRYAGLLPTYRRIMPNLSNAQLVVRIATDVGMWRSALLQAARGVCAHRGSVDGSAEVAPLRPGVAHHDGVR